MNYIPACGQYQYWDGVNKVCNCNLGYVWINGQCLIINQCDELSYWNGYQCNCIEGYVYSSTSQKCIQQPPVSICPPHSSFNGVFCCCDDGYYPIKEKTCQQCPSQSYWNGASCSVNKTCQINYYWDDQSISCRPVVAQCGLNEKWNGVSCVCIDLYDRVNGVCQLCPASTFFDGRTCVYGKNYCL